jgi:hypothetical protein
MTSKEVNASFSLTISLEYALALLSRCNQKTPISTHPAKPTEKANPPKRQSAQSGEKVPTFKKIPVTTLRRILSTLSERYGDNVFRTADAQAIAVKFGLSKTLTGYALQFALKQGEIHKVSLGKYSFRAKTNYVPAPEALIDIVTGQVNSMMSVLKLMACISDRVSLYFSELGLVAHFFTNKDRNALHPLRI